MQMPTRWPTLITSGTPLWARATSGAPNAAAPATAAVVLMKSLRFMVASMARLRAVLDAMPMPWRKRVGRKRCGLGRSAGVAESAAGLPLFDAGWGRTPGRESGTRCVYDADITPLT